MSKNVLAPEQLASLQQIARDLAFEPFEGRKSLDTIQETRSKMEKGIAQIKEKSIKAGKWLKKTKAFNASKSKIIDFTKELKENSSSGRFTEILNKINESTEEYQKIAKSTYQNLEEKAKDATLLYTKKGLEFLLFDDTEKWIFKKANPLLNRTDINSIEQIKELDSRSRDILINELYPYNSPAFSKYLQTVEKTLNITLGAIVATNLPGSGIAVSLVNMGKTLVKLGNRINIMSAIYGQKVSSPEALFRCCSQILQSLEDWENNENHQPLDPIFLDELYGENPADEAAFQELLNTIAKKEAYIAIPGVGMISIGKIGLDDLKMDIVVQHLIQNYFSRKSCIKQFGENRTAAIVHDYKMIYMAVLKLDYFKSSRKVQESELLESSDQKWKTRLLILAGIESILEASTTDLDQTVREIYLTLQNVSEAEKPDIIKKEIENAFKEG